MIPPQQQPDIAGAVLALDQAMIALAVAKSTLLGETSRPLDLAAAEASPANPYGSVRLDSLRGREHYGEPTGLGRYVADVAPFPRFPHLAEHTHGSPVCDLCGIDHDAAARLAPPAGYQIPSASIPGEGA